MDEIADAEKFEPQLYPTTFIIGSGDGVKFSCVERISADEEEIPDLLQLALNSSRVRPDMAAPARHRRTRWLRCKLKFRL